LGLTQVGLPTVGAVLGIALILAIAFLAYRLTTPIRAWRVARAEKAPSHVDEIAASLGAGPVKLLIVIGAIVAAADVVGLPYDGLPTGLCIGGVAAAFAARHRLQSDRPPP
jgi:hypothetical protein